MHGIVGRASIIIIVSKQVIVHVITLHNKLKHLDIQVRMSMYVVHILIKQSVHISKTSSIS